MAVVDLAVVAGLSKSSTLVGILPVGSNRMRLLEEKMRVVQ